MHEYTLRLTIIKKLFWCVCFFFKSGSPWRTNTEEIEALQWSLRSSQWWNPPQTLSTSRVFDGESFSDSLELWEADRRERRGGYRDGVIELNMDRGCRIEIHTHDFLPCFNSDRESLSFQFPVQNFQNWKSSRSQKVIRIPPALTFFRLQNKKNVFMFTFIKSTTRRGTLTFLAQGQFPGFHFSSCRLGELLHTVSEFPPYWASSTLLTGHRGLKRASDK